MLQRCMYLYEGLLAIFHLSRLAFDVPKYYAWQMQTQTQTSASGPCHICGLALMNVPKLMYDFGSDAKNLMGQ